MKIRYTRANLHGLGPDHVLRPGDNEVPDEVWAAYAEHPVTVAMIAEGAIEVLGTPVKAKGKRGKGKTTESTDAAAQLAQAALGDEAEGDEAEGE